MKFNKEVCFIRLPVMSHHEIIMTEWAQEEIIKKCYFKY